MHFLLISFLLPFLSFTLADINGPTYPNATVTTTTNTIVTATTNATVSVTTSATVSITTSATGYSTSTTLLPTSFPTLTPVGFEYYLRSQLARTGGPARFANLYVQAYHTGAGLNDVVLLERDEYSAKGFLNDSYQEFDLGNNFPYGFYLGGDTNYAAWELVSMNAGPGDAGFSLTDDGLQYESSEFQGWLVSFLVKAYRI
ncbi:hypothetical protein MMC06_000494 [Schaereria dolodes]|nr:hypothetical protein [Schaereria dolodes]